MILIVYLMDIAGKCGINDTNWILIIVNGWLMVCNDTYCILNGIQCYLMDINDA